jgi:hypothetical protein
VLYLLFAVACEAVLYAVAVVVATESARILLVVHLIAQKKGANLN